MCMSIKRRCQCGRGEAQFMHRDNLLPPEVLVNLYCPECRPVAVPDAATVVEDCGWALEYDLEEAEYQFYKRGISQEITPAFIFDEGYISWNGLTPHDLEERTRLHNELAPLLNQDRRQYITQIKARMLQLVADLKAEGWRKAQKA